MADAAQLAAGDDRTARINAGVALYNSGRNRDAAQALLNCLPLFAAHEQNTREFAALCANLGAALAESGQPRAAEQAMGTALQWAQKHGDALGQARAHFNLGNLARQSGSLQSCHDHYLQALACAARGGGTGARQLQARCQLNLSQLMLSLGQASAARDRLQQAQQQLLADDAADAELQWSLQMQLGQLAMQAQQTEAARRHLGLALSQAQVLGLASCMAQAQAALGELAAQGSAVADAHMQQQQRLQSLRQRWQQARAQGSPALLEDALALAQGLALAWASAPEHEATVLQHEAQTLHAQSLQLIETWGQNWHGPQRYHFMERVSPLVQHVVLSHLAQGQTAAAFEASEHGQGRALLDLMQGAASANAPAPAPAPAPALPSAPASAPATYAEVASALAASNTHLLKLYFAQGQLHAWWALPDGSLRSWDASAALPALHEALALAADWKGADTVVDWPRLQTALAQLGAALLPALIRAHLLQHQGRLLLVPHQALFMLPFAAMPLQPAVMNGATAVDTWPVLGQGWQLSICASASCWLQHRRQAPSGRAPLPALVVADCGAQRVQTPLLPSLGSETYSQTMAYDALAGARSEGQAVHALTGGVLLMGEAANKTAVMLMLPLADCVHLATHGQWDPLGDNTYLVLAGHEGGAPGHNALLGRDLQGLRLRAQLVVLSACQTGLGGVHADSYIGLGHSFLAAGARCVLVSLWPLPDDTTCAFMTQFHTALQAGAAPAQALQHTQAAFRADPLTAEGENWAGFQLLGQAWAG